MTLPLDTLERLVRAATPGFWTNKCKKHIDYHVDAQVHPAEQCKAIEGERCDHVKEVARDCTQADSAFIAACSPEVIVALVARVRELEKLERIAQQETDYADLWLQEHAKNDHIVMLNHKDEMSLVESIMAIKAALPTEEPR